jgi:hypothetical protein
VDAPVAGPGSPRRSDQVACRARCDDDGADVKLAHLR